MTFQVDNSNVGRWTTAETVDGDPSEATTSLLTLGQELADPPVEIIDITWTTWVRRG